VTALFNYGSRNLNQAITSLLGVLLCAFTLIEVNYPLLIPQSRLAIFALIGLVLCFLNIPLHPTLKESRLFQTIDKVLAIAVTICCGYIVVQSDPLFESWWVNSQSLGNRAGFESLTDTIVGIIGLLLVIEAARRSIGLALPILATTFLIYAYFGSLFPDWLFPHRGYPLSRIVSQTFLHSQGIFGLALNVMFTYVFLFVIFGAFLEATGATRFIVDFAKQLFGRSPGGPAKVAILSSALMGSLSGSAVANTATTGTFTIPMMRSAGLKPVTAAGVQAAASSGGSLMPPVMGAGAYMMLEIVEPPVTYLEIVRAAIIPALLYYLSLLLIVHLHARLRSTDTTVSLQNTQKNTRLGMNSEGMVFITALGSLVLFLMLGYTAFRAVTLSIVTIIITSSFSVSTRLEVGKTVRGLIKASRDVVPLIAASACVGIIIGIVTLTGIGTRLPATIISLSEQSLFLALVLIMFSSIILGMGLPSAVCYLLMATLIGPVLGNLGVIPLAAHLFIFYFGMMSMVTPPVSLAAYAAASIAGTNIMQTSFAAFRFAIVGFTLPYMFIYRPELLMLAADGTTPSWGEILLPVLVAILGITCFAAGIVGQLRFRLGFWLRLASFSAAALLLAPGPAMSIAGISLPVLDVAGFIIFSMVLLLNHH
jgi:TRAP transporter 4TM/12TM fusion protein